MSRLTIALLALSAVCAQAGDEPTPEALGKQFDAQVARLIERGYPKMFGDRAVFDKEMSRLREEAVKYKPTKPGYTFLVVIPGNRAPMNWQIAQIIMPTGETCEIREPHIGLRGRLEMQNRGDFKTPQEPYLLCDVSEGDDTAKRWVCDIIPELRDAGRRGLTFEECIALLVQRPEILGTRKIAAVGMVIVDNNHGNPSEQFAHWQLDISAPHNPCVNLAPWKSFNVTRGGAFSAWGIIDYQFPSCQE